MKADHRLSTLPVAEFEHRHPWRRLCCKTINPECQRINFDARTLIIGEKKAGRTGRKVLLRAILSATIAARARWVAGQLWTRRSVSLICVPLAASRPVAVAQPRHRDRVEQLAARVRGERLWADLLVRRGRWRAEAGREATNGDVTVLITCTNGPTETGTIPLVKESGHWRSHHRSRQIEAWQTRKNSV